RVSINKTKRFLQRATVLIVIGGVLVISGSAFGFMPKWIADFGASLPVNSNLVQNLAKDTLIKSLQIVGGFALVITAYLSWRDWQNSGDKHITGRFNKAVEKLSSKKLEVQLGGIHSLGRIAQESPTDYGTIVKVLTAFIRAKAFFPSNSRDYLIKQFSWTDDTSKTQVYKPQGVTRNVQTALTVIGRRSEDPHNLKLDLSNTNLCQANLRKANLKQANLYSAVLSQADFRKADLREASFLLAILSGGPKNRARTVNFGAQMTRFDQANLSQANLMGAFMSYRVSFKGVDLSMANLTDAQVEGVFFHNANLQKADFSRANLKEAIFRMANLSDAVLDNANLRGTDFRGAKNLTIEQVKSAQYWGQASYDDAFKQKLELT
ncbi:MAG: pentapeptide repeat-containing protein, partial [Pseudanabaenales cyanobacterium]|nr:pentapeptide repeat-containing protein [Pseudanabaenales cyanobacterium]